MISDMRFVERDDKKKNVKVIVETRMIISVHVRGEIIS